MKPLFPFLTLAIVSSALALQAAPDYAGLNQAVTNYFASLDKIAKKLPTVDTAPGTAELVNEWALANEIFADAGEQFAAKNPEVIKLPEPPPEFAAAFGRLSRLKTDYAPLPAGVGALIKRFHDDPDVANAYQRFLISLARVQRAGSLPKK
jgi:hypothetical protein